MTGRAKFKKFIDILRNYDIKNIERVYYELDYIFEHGSSQDIEYIINALQEFEKLSS